MTGKITFSLPMDEALDLLLMLRSETFVSTDEDKKKYITVHDDLMEQIKACTIYSYPD